MKSAFAFVAFTFFLLLPEAPALSGGKENKFQVSVYADVNTSPQSIPYERIDGLVLAFINPVDDCRGFSETEFPRVQEIVRRARAQEANGRQITVAFAIGGGGGDDTEITNQRLESIASREGCRKQFAGQVAEILAKNDLNGVNIDWEFPKSSSLGNYTLLIKALRKSIGTKILSIAIYDDSGKEDASGRLTKDVFPFVDSYMVMAYLGPRNDAIRGWINPPWNLPKSKLQLGLAFFGIPDGIGYNRLLGSVPPAQVNPCGDQVGIYKFNGLRTTRELTRFAMTEELGGITAWELGQDRTDSISLLNAASETSRMWENFEEWRPGTTYSVGTVIRNRGNLWLVKSSAPSPRPGPSLANSAFKQIEVTKEWSAQNYYCGGDEVWFGDAVYRAVQDPMLSMTNLSPTEDRSLWKKLYTASLYDNSKTYKKGERVFFNSSVYAANKKTRGQSPAKALASWSPFVDTEAFDFGKSYSPGALVRYMGNKYISTKSSRALNPVVATDFWEPLIK
ncbi:MAG: glycoside hydrolase family 18 protein [Acidobacteriota bacterium]|nr:glycoside hydrolase family 18 protein [Acidobacteriota bacterium]